MSMSERLAEERRAKKEMPVSDYFHGKQRVHDDSENVDIVKIFSGDWYVSTKGGEMLATILGSCVSACIRDPVAKIGGMNHFLLPGDESVDSKVSDSARYGVFAMESLINGILKAGGQKHRFEVKVFGGGNVINNSARIGSKNAQFIREFLKKEGYRITSEDLEGDHPRRLHYFPDTGKVMMRLLRRKEDMVVVEEEARYKKEIAAHTTDSNIELF
ncbi:MAG: chemoreceptor glutamine deamidase CheD [Alphaproteobacteria bacterium]|nr:chemoreceptor glutamine deamidase CheD [Alphaproteobacteria bacterium]